MRKHEDLNKNTMTNLRTLDPQRVTSFRIYPRVTKPVNTFVSFLVPDPLIEEFFQALAENSEYRPNHDTAQSRDHSWCVEVAAESEVFQIEFYIPAEKNHIVAGHPLGRGWFQSQSLYQWYQKYSHRWLNSEEAQ